MRVQLLSFVRLFAIPRIVARQTPLSLDFPGRNTGVGSPLLFSRIFPTQGSNPCLLYWQVYSLPLYHLGSPRAVIIKYHKVGGPNSRNALSHRSGGWKAGSELIGLFSPEGCEEDSIPVLLPSFICWQSLTFLGM